MMQGHRPHRIEYCVGKNLQLLKYTVRYGSPLNTAIHSMLPCTSETGATRAVCQAVLLITIAELSDRKIAILEVERVGKNDGGGLSPVSSLALEKILGIL